MTWGPLIWVAVLTMAYLLGSVPSAYLAGRVVAGVDIRHIGDRNPGAQNAYHALGQWPGLMVGFLDITKGIIVVVLARLLLGSTEATMAAGAVAVIGHNWPFYLGFRGGRGAATAIGTFIGLMPIPALLLSVLAFASLPILKKLTRVIAVIMVLMPLLAWADQGSILLVAYIVLLEIGVGITHYFSSRGFDRD